MIGYDIALGAVVLASMISLALCIGRYRLSWLQAIVLAFAFSMFDLIVFFILRFLLFP